MDYYGLLFLYYLKGLSGKSILRLFFNIEAGGTEQLLPENASTPTTTPILADIQYPDGLRTDQYFTYRETPTTVSNKARIKTIKGNTLVWNQLVQNGNFANASGWLTSGRGTITISDNTATIVPNRSGLIMTGPSINITNGHKYLLSAEIKADSTSVWIGMQNNSIHVRINSNGSGQWQRITSLVTNFVNDTSSIPVLGDTRASEWTASQIRNFMFIDITKLGIDITNPSEFTALFDLPYYDYNPARLLSFNGTGIKTVGKNLFDLSQFANGTITFENGVLTGTAGQFYTAYRDAVNNGIELKYPKNTQITISFDMRTEQNQASTGGGLYFVASENGATVQLAGSLNNTTEIQHKTVTIPSNRHIDKLGWSYGQNPSNIWHITNFQVEFGTTETSYEPYTSSTLSLPVSTYFPTGMKSAGTAYDELTPKKAITRIGAVDLGSLDWSYVSAYGGAFQSSGIASVVADSNNPLCAIYTKFAPNSEGVTNTNMGIAINANGNGGTIGGAYGFKKIVITNRTYTDATEFKTAMSGVYLYFELATYTETPIATEDANEALSLLMGKSVSSNNAKQMINIITKGE